MRDKAQDLAQSWERNAANWTRVVRDGLIASRKAGTDAAMLDAIAALAPKRLLDIGCGEGWLVRAAAGRTGCAGVGIDGSAELIAAAQAADTANRYLVLDYTAFTARGAAVLGEGFDVAVFNYALFEEDVAPVLRAAAALLTPDGVIIVQTLHPGAADAASDGWLVEDFSAFQGGGWAPMPWYSRSLASWRNVVEDAGLSVVEIREPKAPDRRVLSLLMICKAKG